MDYRVIPATTFIDPEVARVGLNEQEAKAQGIAYEVTRFELAELDRAIAEGATSGFVKVLTEPGRDRILGACIVGERAGICWRSLSSPCAGAGPEQTARHHSQLPYLGGGQ